MKKFLFTAALLFSTSATALPISTGTLSEDGFGKVKIGMTLKQASKALGHPLKLSGDYDYAEDSCDTGKLAENLNFLYVDGKIAMISIWNEKEGTNHPTPPITYKSKEGAMIGMSEDDLKKLYPNAVIENHAYIAGGHYFKVYDKNGRGYKFETNGVVVISISAGITDELNFTEECG